MTFDSMLELGGYFLGTGLSLHLLSVSWRRPNRERLERVLFALVLVLLLWYAGNFASILLRQMAFERVGWTVLLVEAVAYAGLAMLPALLLHAHWEYYRSRAIPGDRLAALVRVVLPLQYLALSAAPFALLRLLQGGAASPVSKLEHFAIPFGVLLSGSCLVVAGLQWRILREARSPVERALFQKLMPILLGIAAFILFAVMRGDQAAFPVALAKLSSLLPLAIVVYYVHFHRFLQIPVNRSIASALLILVTLSAYAVGVRRLDDFLVRNYEAPPLLLEIVFLALALLFFPTLSRWLERRVEALFSGRLRVYRELGEEIQRMSRQVSPQRLPDLIEEELRARIPGSVVSIHPFQAENRSSESQPPNSELQSDASWFPLRSGGRLLGHLEMRLPQAQDSSSEREALLLLVNEIAAALDTSRLVENQLAMQRELARKSHMEDLGRMAATVAHNVKNPLSSMKTLLQLLGESDNLTPDQRKEVAMMIAEVDHLSQTVTSLLQFSRPASERSKPAGPVVVRKILEESGQVFAGDLRAGQLTLEVRVDPSGLVAEVDPALLRDVLRNLLSNSIEACGRGSRIRLEAHSDALGWEIRVSDDGKGIPPSIREQLFEPFVTDRSKGTGLGLAIVRSKVEQLGGVIESLRVEKGACFRMRFARKLVEASQRGAPDASPATGGSVTGGSDP